MTTQQQHDDEDGAPDLLVGAGSIKSFLLGLGMHSSIDPYYLKRSNPPWPIGNTSGSGKAGRLVASKRALRRHLAQIAAGPKTAA